LLEPETRTIIFLSLRAQAFVEPSGCDKTIEAAVTVGRLSSDVRAGFTSLKTCAK
jgi:hypothetical protein